MKPPELPLFQGTDDRFRVKVEASAGGTGSPGIAALEEKRLLRTPPRFTAICYELRVLTDEPPKRVDLLQRNLAKYGTVYNTLAEVCEISGDIVP